MLIEELEKIVKNEEDILTFLQKLSSEDKKKLRPFLKKFRTKVFAHEEVVVKNKWGGSFTYKPTHTNEQRNIVDKVCFLCYNKSDIKTDFFSQNFVSDDFLENILPWFTPSWFSDLINEEMPWSLNYEKVMLLTNKGWLNPSKELILNKLPNCIIKSIPDSKKHSKIYVPDELLKHEVTLKEHIWLFFEEESFINNYYNYLHLENYDGGNDLWIDTFFNLTENQKLDRKRVLEATIYTATKGFNQRLSGWFYDLLIKLNPTKEEILSLQDEFFAALNSPHSKILNVVLKYFKSVASYPDFNYKIFTENVSVLLNSDTKSVVNSVLMILEKIAKTHTSYQTFVSKRASEGLLNVDEKIQLRAAKLIVKYGTLKNQELVEELQLYSSNLFYSTNEILKEYIHLSKNNEELNEEPQNEEVPKVLSPETRLPVYNTLEELIFFVSQAIDNNEVYHIDLLIHYLPKLNLLLTPESVAKLEPIFKRALDLTVKFELSSQIGNLELEASSYVNDFSEILMEKFPKELSGFKRMKKAKIDKLKELSYYATYFEYAFVKLETKPVHDFIYRIHRSLLVKSKSFIKKGLALDLLSTPTHYPCWIEPESLINRIVSFENSPEDMALIDFQIAVGRLPMIDSSENILSDIEKINDYEIKEVLKYHFGFLDIKNAKISKPNQWIQSVISRNKSEELAYFQEAVQTNLSREIGKFEWESKLRTHFYQDYDYKSKKQIQKKIEKVELRFTNFQALKEPQSVIKSIKGVFSKKKSDIKVHSFYQYIHPVKNLNYSEIRPHDDVRFLYLSPNNPSMFLSYVVHNNMKESTFWDETSKKNMVNLLKGLYEIWHRADYKEATYLFLSTGLLCSDKVSRELAAEIWIKTNSMSKINNGKLGEILGKLMFGEYAPLKRFTDLLVNSLFNISKRHNELLINLIDSMLGNMNSSPIRGLNKLLQLFLELKYRYPEKKMNQKTSDNLAEWKNTRSLKKVVLALETTN